VSKDGKFKPKDPTRYGIVKLRFRWVEGRTMHVVEDKSRRMIAAFLELSDALDFIEGMPLILD